MENQNHFQVHLLQNTAAYKQKSSSMPAQKKGSHELLSFLVN